MKTKTPVISDMTFFITLILRGKGPSNHEDISTTSPLAHLMHAAAGSGR
jgi:hypothetical protein